MPLQDRMTSAEVALEGDHFYIHEGKGFLTPFTISSLAAYEEDRG